MLTHQVTVTSEDVSVAAYHQVRDPRRVPDKDVVLLPNPDQDPRSVPGETRTDYPSLCVTSKNKGEYVLQRSRL